MKLLLIEDDVSFRETLAYALKRRGCEILQAGDGAEALTVPAKGEALDGILLDMRLGSEDGMSLIPELKRRFPLSRLIVLTGYGSIPGAMEAVRLGADDYLLKPVGVDRIVAAFAGGEKIAPLSFVEDLPSLARVEWEHIQRVLSDCGGNVSHAAEALGIDRRTLQRKLSKLPPSS
jgi:two-component system, response regulator RegA